MQAVSDAHTHLFAERERLLQLRAENDALRAQEVADRARIQRLLSLGSHACHASQVMTRPQASVTVGSCYLHHVGLLGCEPDVHAMVLHVPSSVEGAHFKWRPCASSRHTAVPDPEAIPWKHAQA